MIGGLLFAAIVLGGAAVAVGFARRRYANWRTLLETAATPIAEAQPGRMVKLVGVLRPGRHPLAAPLSGRACAAYDIIVEHRVEDGGWGTTLRETRVGEFFVEDDSGRVLVRAQGVMVDACTDREYDGGRFDDPTEEMKRFLARHGERWRGRLGLNRQLRFREGVLGDGDTVAVMGRGRREVDPDGAHGYRDAAQRLVLLGGPGAPVLVSNDPRTTVPGSPISKS